MPERQEQTEVERWVEITLRLPQDEYVHPDLVRDDVLAQFPWDNVTGFVSDTSPGYSDGAE